MGGRHHHDHDDLTAVSTSDKGIRAVKVSLAILAATALVQFVIYWASGSVALLADTVHNLGDALTAAPLWIAFVVGRRPANRRYTYGYGRAEDVAGIVILAVIASSAVFAGWQSIQRLISPQAIHNAGWVMAAALAGFAGNELVALYRIRVGRQIGSAALVADGLHARSDGLTSLGVLAAALAWTLGWRWADPVVGLLITGAIVHILFHAGREVYARLMDAVPADLVQQAEEILAETQGVEKVEEVCLRWVGHRLRAEAKIVIDSDRTFPEAHRISEAAHHHLMHHLPLAEAVIHANPCGHDGTDHHFEIAHHFA